MLRNPVHFVCPNDKLWLELQGGEFPAMSVERLTECSGGILNSWIVRTYYQLGRAGAPVTTSSRPRRDAINIVSVSAFGRRDRLMDAFIVIPRGDFHKPKLANFVIEQNRLENETDTSASIPHWPQPGIIKRDPSRGCRIEKISFKGRTHNLDEEFRSQAFIDALSKLDIKLELDSFEGIWSPHSWNDYYECDAVLAVRNIRGSTAKSKPASKLVNAWLANVVPLLGPEPAYQELRRSSLDYIEIYSAKDAIEALKYLKDNPTVFSKIIENGDQRSHEFTEEKITRIWIDALNGPVSEAFERWKRKPLLRRFIEYGVMTYSEKQSKDLFSGEIRAGKPILDTAPRTYRLSDLEADLKR